MPMRYYDTDFRDNLSELLTNYRKMLTHASASNDKNYGVLISGEIKEVDKALKIVAGLDTSVMYDPKDPNQVKVAKNFKNLYAVFTDRLMLASSRLTTEPLDEILNYARQVKTAWDQIPESAKQEGYTTY